MEIHGGFEFGKSKYQILDESDELAWTADFIKTYRSHLDFGWERGGFLKEISLEGGWEKRGVYNEEFTAAVPGSQISVEGQLTLRPRSNLEWSFEGDWIRQAIDGTGEEVFNGLAYETALHYQVTRCLFLNTRLSGKPGKTSTASISSSGITSGPGTSSSFRSRRANGTNSSAGWAATPSPSKSLTSSGYKLLSLFYRHAHRVPVHINERS